MPFAMLRRFSHFSLDKSIQVCLNMLAVKSYTTVQAAKQLKVSRDTIYRWMRANNVRGARVTKIGELRLRLWTEDDLDRIRRWMTKHPHANRGKKREK